MNRDNFIGAFFGGIVAMMIFAVLEYMWDIGGLAPMFYVLLLSGTMMLYDIFGGNNERK